MRTFKTLVIVPGVLVCFLLIVIGFYIHLLSDKTCGSMIRWAGK
jgi:hypothetical protein